MKKRNEKRKRDPKLKLPVRQILRHNLYMVGLIYEVAPVLVWVKFILAVFSSVSWFLSSTYLLQYSLNAVSDGKPFAEVVWMVLLFIFIVVALDFAHNAIWYWWENNRRVDVRVSINCKLYDKARRVELACYENPAYYDKFVKAAGEADVRAFNVLNTMTGLLSDLLRLALSITLLVTLHPLFILIALIPLTSVGLRKKGNRISYERDMKIRTVDRKKGYPSRVFFTSDYAKELRLTNMSDYLFKYLYEASEECREIHLKQGGRFALVRIAVELIDSFIAPAVSTIFAVWRTVVLKVMKYGDCFVALNATAQLSGALLGLSNDLVAFQEHALYIQTLREFLDYEIKITDGDKPLPGDGDIVLEHVSFRYDGCDKYVLEDLSMTFGAGQKIAVVGANGAGKSTLVKILLRLYDPEGSITYGGVPLPELNITEYRDIFSAVMQDYHVFALTAAENVTLARREEGDGGKITEALRNAGIYDKIIENGGDIERPMTREFDKDGMQLSGGEIQKLAIAHVYSKSNRFVILDEPSSALDPIAEYNMYDTMLRACADSGVIFISHRLSSAVLADKIYLIDGGRVAECGTHAELMAAGGAYATMFRRQAENYVDSEKAEEVSV